jgi:excisionase family DNA binding protein
MEELFTPVEAAEYLKVTKAAIYKWIKEGRLAVVYVGSDRRITKSAIEAFIAASTEAKRKVDDEDTIENKPRIPGLVAQPEFAPI